jgi:uncharacterized membrane protein
VFYREALRHKKLQIPKESAVKYFDRLLDLINAVLAQIASILYVENRAKTIKCAVGLYVLGVVGNWVSFPTLLTIVVLMIFALPKGYELLLPYMNRYVKDIKQQLCVAVQK